MKRLLGILIFSLMLLFILGGIAQGITVQGGDAQEEAWVMDGITSWPDWWIVDEEWNHPNGISVVFEDIDYGGLAGYGTIKIDSDLGDSPANSINVYEAAIHEFCHEAWWLFSGDWRQVWFDLNPSENPLFWYFSPTEHWAECMRMAMFDPSGFRNNWTQTVLPGTPDDAANVLADWLAVTLKPTITISQPVGSVYQQNHNIYVNWTSTAVTDGDFAIWIRQYPNTWYAPKLVQATGATSYQTIIQLNVPVGINYQVIVGYRPHRDWGTWRSWATSPGMFGVNR